MNNDEKIKAVEHWQNEVAFHPLTCANDRKELKAREYYSIFAGVMDVELYCPWCDYTQLYIPEVVLRSGGDIESP